MRHRNLSVATATNTKHDLFENWSQTVTHISFAIATTKRSFDAFICRIWANGFITDMKSINNFFERIVAQYRMSSLSLYHFTCSFHPFCTRSIHARHNCSHLPLQFECDGRKNWDNKINCTMLGVHFKVDCLFGAHNETNIAEKSIQSAKWRRLFHLIRVANSQSNPVQKSIKWYVVLQRWQCAMCTDEITDLRSLTH